MMDWWDLGEWTGRPGHVLAMHEIPCAFCSSVGNFGVVNRGIGYRTVLSGNC